MGLHRHLMPRTHRIAPACAALFLAAAGGGGAAHAFVNAGRHVDLGVAPEACSDACRAPAYSHSLPGERPTRSGARVEDALHGCDSVDIATRADRLALVLHTKKAKKKVKAFRQVVPPLPVRAMRIPMIDVGPQRVWSQTHPAIPLLCTVVLLV